MTVSGLYSGVTTHTRFRPRGHRLRYRIFMLLLDLDELPALDARLKLFGEDRFRLTSFSQRDHLAGSATPLKAQVEAHLAAAGIPHGGPIRLLCMPRILGGVFNPLSVYFCHRPDDARRLTEECAPDPDPRTLIARHLGKAVDALLVDRQPVGWPQLGAFLADQIVRLGIDRGHAQALWLDTEITSPVM